MNIIQAEQAKQEMIDYCFATDKNLNVVLNGLNHFQAKYLNRFLSALEDHNYEDAMAYDVLVDQAKDLYNDKVKEH